MIAILMETMHAIFQTIKKGQRMLSYNLLKCTMVTLSKAIVFSNILHASTTIFLKHTILTIVVKENFGDIEG